MPPQISQKPIYIAGEWHLSSESFEVRNPFDASLLAHVSMGGKAELARTLDAAQAAFPAAAERAGHARATILLRAAQLIEARKTQLAATIVAEAGKPLALAEAEVARAVMTFTCAAEEARRWQGEPLSIDGFSTGQGHVGLVRRFPLGIVYGITPFNFPLNLVAHKVAPAIACGCPILIKPSPRTPLSALALAEILHEAGLPAGELSVLTLPNDLAAAPIDDPRVRVVSFTGSAPIGWALKARAGSRKVLLELGGNAPVIVHEDADIAAAVPLIASGAFGYAGQSCISVQRILVHASIYEKLRGALLAHIESKVKVGDPQQREVLVGPMITAEARERTELAVKSAVAAGAQLLAGGRSDGSCFLPTLLENVPSGDVLCTQEAFAPIAILARYETFEEALRFANATPYGLQAGVFTRDIGRIWTAFSQLEFGAVLVNQVPTFRVESMPYGGVKDSGSGREGPRYAMEEMTEPRALILKTG